MGDIYGKGKRVERALNLLRDSELSESNKCYLEDFVQVRMADNISDKRIYRDIQNFRHMSELIDFELKKASKSDIIKLLSAVNHNDVPGHDWAPATRKDVKKSIRNYFNAIDRSDLTDFISLNIKPSERKMVDPDELPMKSEVAKLRDAMCNERDKAFLSIEL